MRNSYEERVGEKRSLANISYGWRTIIIIISFHFDEFSPLIRESIEPSPAILITHGHRVTPPPPVSPLGHKTLYNFADKKVSTIRPRVGGLNQYRVARDWIVPRQSRHFAATRVEFCGFCATRYTLLLAKSRPKGLVRSDRVKTWQRNGRSWLRYAEFPIFTPHPSSLNVFPWTSYVRKDFDEPDGFLSFFFFPLPFLKSRFTFSSGKK